MELQEGAYKPVSEDTRAKAGFKRRLKPSEIRNLWLSRVFIWIVIVITLYPVVWVLAASMSKGDNFYLGSIFPKEYSLVNYKKVIIETDFLIWVKNSLLVCLGVSVIQLFLTATAAYAFSRMRFRGRKYGLMSLLILQLFPSSMAMSAIYIIVARLDLVDNLFALVLLLAGGSAFNIWLLKGYIDRLPRELDEAALADGASHFQVFWRIILPLASPMLVVIFLFSFIGAYTEFVITSIVAQSPESYTLVVGLRSFITDHFGHWTQFSAAAIMSSLPIMGVFMLLQKYIQGGLAAGAVKG
ncbi:MAG: sugar ABC transporter permease [Clostridia bacterium]|nr:sugar ABC transporter permease [Clostridia bacterium]